MNCRVHLTRAQLSALECSGIEEDTEPLVIASWGVGAQCLVFAPAIAGQLADEIMRLADSEGEQWEHTKERAALGAWEALTNLAKKVRRCPDAPDQLLPADDGGAP